MMLLDLLLVGMRKSDVRLRRICLGALLISEIFNEQNRERIEYIVEEIRLAFIETLPNIRWMDWQTKQQAQLKATMIIGRNHHFHMIETLERQSR